MLDRRLFSYHLYHQLLGNKKSTRYFPEFCRQHHMRFHYITRENKNSELLEGQFLQHPLTFFGKRLPMTPNDFEMLHENNHVRVDQLLDPQIPRTVWREIFILRMLNDLLLRKITPHFPLFYGHHFSFDGDNYHDGKSRPYVILLQETMQEDLKTWARRKQRSEKEWFSCLFQIFFAVGTLQHHLGISHKDLHWGNVLVQRLDPPQSWTYQLPGHEPYSLVDQTYLFTICDFGSAQFEIKDEMFDFCRLALNVFQWLKYSPGENMDQWVVEMQAVRDKKWKHVLEHVVAKRMVRKKKEIVYTME